MGTDVLFENQVCGSLCITVYYDEIKHSAQHNVVQPKTSHAHGENLYIHIFIVTGGRGYKM